VQSFPISGEQRLVREAADYGLTYGDPSAKGAVQDAEQIFEIVSGYLAKQVFSTPST